MNWIVGLKRTAALICGGMALFLVGVAISENVGDRNGQAFGFSIGVIVAALFVYKAACWLIDGFAGNSKA